VDRRPVAPQEGLANAVEVDDDGCYRITFLRAACDRFADKLIRKRRGTNNFCILTTPWATR
jgi:hypothetical protein